MASTSLLSLRVIASFRYLETISAHKSSVNTMVFCEAHDYLVTAGRDSSINLWSTISLSPENLYKRVGSIERRDR